MGNLQSSNDAENKERGIICRCFIDVYSLIKRYEVILLWFWKRFQLFLGHQLDTENEQSY